MTTADRTQGAPTDRERRARLEQLQTELRDARALQGLDPAAALRDLETTRVAEAARATAADVRVRALKEEIQPAEDRVAWLKHELEDAQIRARGKHQRHTYMEWVIPSTAEGTAHPLIVIAPIVFLAAVIAMATCTQ